MSDFEIEREFQLSITTLKGEVTELANAPVERINTSLETYPDLWLKFNIARGNTLPVTLGLMGDDNHTGFMQLDINVPYGTGSGQAVQLAAKVKQFYRAGKRFGPAVVASSSVSSGRFVGSWYRVSVTVFYYSRIARLA